MSEIPPVPPWTRDAFSAKFGHGAEYGAAMWAWVIGWADCREAIHAALDAASVPVPASRAPMPAYLPTGAYGRHRHGTSDGGYVEHEHLGGGIPHGHDPETGFQVPLDEEGSPSCP